MTKITQHKVKKTFTDILEKGEINSITLEYTGVLKDGKLWKIIRDDTIIPENSEIFNFVKQKLKA